MENVRLWVTPASQTSCPGQPGGQWRIMPREPSDVLREALATLSREAGSIIGILWAPAGTDGVSRAWGSCVTSLESAAMAYGDYETPRSRIMTLESEPGSLREEFDTGPLWITRSESIRKALAEIPPGVRSPRAIRYALRLGLLRHGGARRLPEILTQVECAGEEDLFGYVRDDARELQRDLEVVLTDHLRRIGAWLPPCTRPFHDTDRYVAEASVVIPVKNRKHTIAEAVASALSQETTFSFNVVVVDNHSIDLTGDRARQAGKGDQRLRIVVPARHDLGIGGCWNIAAAQPSAGRYLVQLDSDDTYADSGSLQLLIDRVMVGPWAMVVGAYRTVDMAGKEVPPGIVTHNEWTDENGHNNLLRVSGIGAPRVVATGIVRRHPFPNVSYGEDYAMALRVSRDYHIARLHDIVYLARRWEGNTDHAVAAEVARERETYKNRLRTVEVIARSRRQAL